MLVHDCLRLSAQRTPERTALIFDNTRITYGEFNRAAKAVAGYLSAGGLQRGDRVILYSGNQYETAVGIYAVLMAGGCFSVIHPNVKEGKLRTILANAEPRFVAAAQASEPTVRAAAQGLPAPPQFLPIDNSEQECGFPRILANPPPWQPPRLIDEDLAAIIYTSGSTGDPKGVTMTHRNMIAASRSITSYLGARSDDIVLNLLPFSFDYGLYQLIMAVHMNATLIVEPSFGYSYKLIDLIRNHEVTGLPLVPTIMAILLQLKSIADERLPSVRYISNTAAPLPPSYIPRLQTTFPNARIFSMYGLTECKRVSYVPPSQLAHKPGSVGVPMPNLEAWVADETGREVPRGQVGELVVRGATVMRGYWRDPAASEKRLRPGVYPWEKLLFTGDEFRMDDDGFLYFVARKDDIIKCRGERVHPKEIEDVLYQLDDVLHARVIGVPDEVFGQAIRAEVALKDDAAIDERAILAHCRANLEALLVPQSIWIVPALSLTDSGKIRRTIDQSCPSGSETGTVTESTTEQDQEASSKDGVIE